MKLSLFSASALIMAVATGCSSSAQGDSPPGPLAWNADPASNSDAEISLEGRTEGDRVIVDVVAKGVKDVHGAAFRVKWDPEVLTLASATASDAWSQQAVLLSKEALPGTLAVAWTEKGEAEGHDASERLILGTLTFDAKGRKGSSVVFRTERSALVNHEGKPLPVAWRAGSVPAR